MFNGEKYLKEAVDSILAQTFQDFELVISDNASTDRTEQICREYASKDSRVRYFRNSKNIGAPDNFNRTLSCLHASTSSGLHVTIFILLTT